MAPPPSSSGYVSVHGLDTYWESKGRGGIPLVVVHGGFATVASVAGLVDGLADRRRVIAIELQGHGHTADIDRPRASRSCPA
jgi:pimeloyl-ACP methyl ester carboxylesterase